jgi:hypothetical protein
MMQVARNVTDVRDGVLRDKRYLILDRDAKYTEGFRGALSREITILTTSAAGSSAGMKSTLKQSLEYKNLGAGNFAHRDRAKILQRLVRRINDLGRQVQLIPQAA